MPASSGLIFQDAQEFSSGVTNWANNMGRSDMGEHGRLVVLGSWAACVALQGKQKVRSISFLGRCSARCPLGASIFWVGNWLSFVVVSQKGMLDRVGKPEKALLECVFACVNPERIGEAQHGFCFGVHSTHPQKKERKKERKNERKKETRKESKQERKKEKKERTKDRQTDRKKEIKKERLKHNQAQSHT